MIEEVINKKSYLLSLPDELLNEIFTHRTLFNKKGTKALINLTMTTKKFRIINKIINIIEDESLGFEIYIYQILNKYKFKYPSCNERN